MCESGSENSSKALSLISYRGVKGKRGTRGEWKYNYYVSKSLEIFNILYLEILRYGTWLQVFFP